MTFPTIPTVAAGRVLFTNQADTSGTRTFPSLSGLTKNSGDLLIAIITTYQDSTAAPIFSSWGGGFTEFSDQQTTAGSTMGIGCAYKFSTGSETGTFTVTQAATVTGHASMCLLSIPLAHASTIPEAGTIADGTTADSDPGSFNPTGWGTEDTLWIAVDANGMTNATSTWLGCGATAITNYTDAANSNTTDSSTVGQTEISVAFRQSAAASEDRGPNTEHDLSNARNSSLIIAVRPNLNVTITQSARFDNSNTFYTPKVSHVLAQSARFNNTNTFYTQKVSHRLPQSARFDNSNAFYTPTVTQGAAQLTQSARFDNSNAFYTHTVTPGAVTLTQSARFDNSNAFYSATVTQPSGSHPVGVITRLSLDGYGAKRTGSFSGKNGVSGQSLTQSSRFDNSNAFYSPTVTAGYTLSQSARFDNSNSFYTTTVSSSYSLTQSARFDNTNSFYTAVVTTGAVTLTQSARFDNLNAFYTPIVSQAGAQSLTQSARFDNSNTFYTHTVSQPVDVQLTGGHFGFDEKKRGKRWKKERELEEKRRSILREALYGLPVEAREQITVQPEVAIAEAAVSVVDYRVLLAEIEALAKSINELGIHRRDEQDNYDIAEITELIAMGAL